MVSKFGSEGGVTGTHCLPSGQQKRRSQQPSEINVCICLQRCLNESYSRVGHDLPLQNPYLSLVIIIG